MNWNMESAVRECSHYLHGIGRNEVLIKSMLTSREMYLWMWSLNPTANSTGLYSCPYSCNAFHFEEPKAELFCNMMWEIPVSLYGGRSKPYWKAENTNLMWFPFHNAVLTEESFCIHILACFFSMHLLLHAPTARSQCWIYRISIISMAAEYDLTGK